jgi:U4/U6 small nuclear ribonucleoprotein PRP4
MSDSGPPPAKSKRSAVYGSLESKAADIVALSKNDSPNVPGAKDVMELDNFAAAREQELLAEVELKRKIRLTPVSTDDKEVRKQLREYGEPMTLFGEGAAERRVRLREIIAVRVDDDKFKKPMLPQMPGGGAFTMAGYGKQNLTRSQDKTWYHEGPHALKTMRTWMAEYSLPRAEQRLVQQRTLRSEADAMTTHRAKLQEQQSTIRTLTNTHSQIGDSRPLSHCTFSPNGQTIATSSWSGLCKLWRASDCEEVRTLRGHDMIVSCIEFHPHATLSMPDTAYGCIATADHKGCVNLWSLTSDKASASLPGHDCRVAKLAFHPSGRFLATCVYDNSWRLWDLNHQEELLFQEGHSKPVYDIAFQCDGSVAATVSLDCFGRVWDLRTGRCIMILDGHQRPVYSVDFHPNGHEMATGSEDNTIKIWDLRSRKSIYTIPAHTNIVTRVKFEPNRGHFIASASFDKTVKVWSHPNWTPLISLEGHEGKVTCVDISKASANILTSSFDRTYKLWCPE